MNKNEQFVITINRELGSGGRTVGEKLAEKLGVPFYDKAVIKALGEKFNLTDEEVEEIKGKKSSWWSDFQRMLVPFTDINSRLKYYQVKEGEDLGVFTTEEMFKVESEIIRGLAKNASCVIAGRSGFFVLRNHPNLLSIMIKSPFENRVQRVMEKQNLSHDEAVATIKKIDKMRENYVRKFAGVSRKNTDNYDLVITINGLSEDDAVDIILNYIEKQNRH